MTRSRVIACAASVGLAFCFLAGSAIAETRDLAHSPASEQEALTPLPIFARYSGKRNIARVIVEYRKNRLADWVEVELSQMSRGWGGFIPCGDVEVGTMRYWIQGLDAGGTAVAAARSRAHPYEVPVRSEISVEPAHLPGQSAPDSCKPREAAANAPFDDVETKEPSQSVHFARLWIGVSGAIDFIQQSAVTGACKLGSDGNPVNAVGDYCTNPDGSDFPSPMQNAHLVDGTAAIHSHFHYSDVRLMVALSYAVTANILVGLRFGYALNAYGGSNAVRAGRALNPPIHAELRGSYLFGAHPLSREGFAPTAFAGAGVSQFDGYVTSLAALDNVVGHQPVNVWQTNAPWFVAVGGGLRYQFSPRLACTVEARFNGVIGSNGLLLTFGPEATVEYGF